MGRTPLSAISRQIRPVNTSRPVATISLCLTSIGACHNVRNPNAQSGVTMRKTFLLWALGLVGSMALTAKASGPLHIDRQITLSPGHRIEPKKISRASNGDLIVLGSSDDKAWATRLTSTGEMRWEYLEAGPAGWNDTSSTQPFLGANEMRDQSMLLCGNKFINHTSTVMLVRLDKNGKLL
jgi:hypothetical protein